MKKSLIRFSAFLCALLMPGAALADIPPIFPLPTEAPALDLSAFLAILIPVVSVLVIASVVIWIVLKYRTKK